MSEIKSQFFNGKTYSSTDFVESNKNTMKDGILPNTDFFKVLPASNMTIGVTSGRGWAQGHSFSSDSTLSFKLDNADGVLDRVDTVVIRLDLTTNNEKIECKVVKGTLGGSAATPVRDGTYYDLVIAQIAVAHGTTAITAAMITDKRGDGNLCGWSGAISGDQFNFDVKADKTYCDNTFTTKAVLTAYQLTITNGTTKTNADRLQGKAISTTAPTTGQVLQFDGTQYVPFDKTKFTVLYSGSSGSAIVLANYTIYKWLYVEVYVTTSEVTHKSAFLVKISEIQDYEEYQHLWGRFDGSTLLAYSTLLKRANEMFAIATLAYSGYYQASTIKVWGVN